MIKIETGASSENEAPVNQVTAVKQITYNVNSSAKGQARKSNNKSLSGTWNHAETKTQLQTYLDLGLTPIPLKGKRPIVKWVHGDWNPKVIGDLSRYKNCTNWGLKTGGNFAVIDFDDEHAFYQFVEANAENLPKNTPLVKTGRGYHIWFRPTQPVRNMIYQGIEIKGAGGQIAAPPSIHPKTGSRYKFIWPLDDGIPELDITKLKFPELKVKSNEKCVSKRTSNGSITNSENDHVRFENDRLRFDYELIKGGVGEGERHSTLVSYIGHLISRYLTKEQITILVTDWNRSNRPPLSEEEVLTTVEYCYKAYAKEDSGNSKKVSNKTHYQSNSVFNETQNLQSISHDLPQRTRETPRPTPTHEPVSAWETEDGRPPNYFDCGKKRAVMRRGREFMSVSFFCGRWDCKRCGPYFRRRWIDHLVAKTEGLELYIIEASEADWGRIRRSLNRLGGNYVRIKNGNSFTLITDSPLKPSTPLRQDELQAFLEKAIPSTATQCPISTSRNWKREKNTKKENDFKSVAVTWLPLKDQLEVAQELGAKKVLYNKWISPEETDDTEWAEKFKQGIAERERSILQWLIVPKNSKVIPEMATEWQYYLDQQYAEDAVNDESGYKSFFDSYLVEAA